MQIPCIITNVESIELPLQSKPEIILYKRNLRGYSLGTRVFFCLLRYSAKHTTARAIATSNVIPNAVIPASAIL